MLWIALFLCTNAYANILKAPDSFEQKGKKVIFNDFKTVDSILTYNISNKSVIVTSKIQFETFENGYTVFDLIPKITEAKINGSPVKVSNITSPDKVTQYKLIEKELTAGTHLLEIKNSITENIEWSRDSVKSAFWMSDLKDRNYIEKYLPSNIEYDQYQQNLEVIINGNSKLREHEIFTNGKVTKKTKNHFYIQFPKYFSASSFYFHLSSLNRFYKEEFNYPSISGKNIPIMLYSRYSWNLRTAKTRTISTLKELESKLGPWSHDGFTAYIAGSGGMEHSGATITSLSALGHEITHSYFARGVMPIDGNSGWIDEAIASWRDNGYRSTPGPNFRTTNMSGHSQYRRYTDRKAYTEGANFMAFLNHELESHGGLISFLKVVYNKYSHKSINTHLFKKELEIFSGRDFSAEFSQYIFGDNYNQKIHGHAKENPNHPSLSKKELLQLL